MNLRMHQVDNENSFIRRGKDVTDLIKSVTGTSCSALYIGRIGGEGRKGG